MEGLSQTIENLSSKLDDLRSRNLTELETRKFLIDIVLNDLGWKLDNPESVRLGEENVYGQRPDYCLYLDGNRCLIVEAKALKTKIDLQAVRQLVTYCKLMNIRYGIVTNGEVWEVYDSEKTGGPTDQLLGRLDLKRESHHSAFEQLSVTKVRSDSLSMLSARLVAADAERELPESLTGQTLSGRDVSLNTGEISNNDRSYEKTILRSRQRDLYLRISDHVLSDTRIQKDTSDVSRVVFHLGSKQSLRLLRVTIPKSESHLELMFAKLTDDDIRSRTNGLEFISDKGRPVAKIGNWNEFQRLIAILELAIDKTLKQ